MNADIQFKEGQDAVIVRSDVYRAGNVLRTQIGDLEYAQSFGIDLRYFLESEYAIQNESFKAYTVQRLMESQVNVLNASSVVESMFLNIDYLIGDDSNQSTGLIA